jgi:hypothetical protein
LRIMSASVFSHKGNRERERREMTPAPHIGYVQCIARCFSFGNTIGFAGRDTVSAT